MGKPLPPPLYPRHVIAWAYVRTWLTWPWQVRQMKAVGFRRVGWMTWETGPADVSPLPDPPMQDLPGPPATPWADPAHDVMADLRKAMKLAEQMPPRRELHCARDVAATFAQLGRCSYHVDRQLAYYGVGPLSPLMGIDIIVEGDMPAGSWELREGDTVIESGQIDQEG